MNDTKTHIPEEDIITLLANKDKEILGYIYDQYAPALYGIILRIVRSQDVAEDVLQEVFIKIWKNCGEYNKSKGRLFTWMLNIARNAAIDTTRGPEFKMSAEIQNPAADVDISHERLIAVPHNVNGIGIAEKVSQLKPEHKLVIDTIYFGGYTHAEAAEKLKLPLGTLKTRVKIALRELRKLLN